MGGWVAEVKDVSSESFDLLDEYCLFVVEDVEEWSNLLLEVVDEVEKLVDGVFLFVEEEILLVLLKDDLVNVFDDRCVEFVIGVSKKYERSLSPEMWRDVKNNIGPAYLTP